MKKIIRKFNSFAEEEKANMEFWQGLSGNEKIKILEAIRSQYFAFHHEYTKRFQRVYRIIERKAR
jgi:hypothetical protein